MNPARRGGGDDMLYREYERIRHIEHLLKMIAYASLALDFAIAFATLASLHLLNTGLPSYVLLSLNYILTIEVILTGILFLALVFFRHYHKLLKGMEDVHRSVRHHVRKTIRLSRKRR